MVTGAVVVIGGTLLVGGALLWWPIARMVIFGRTIAMVGSLVGPRPADPVATAASKEEKLILSTLVIGITVTAASDPEIWHLKKGPLYFDCLLN